MPVNAAIKYGIKKYCRTWWKEYGGLVLDEEKQKEAEVIEHIIGDYPQNWVNNDVTEYDIQPYVYPDEAKLKKRKYLFTICLLF